MFKIEDEVETTLGAGRIIEVRDTVGGDVYLVEIQAGGFGRGLSEVFTADEIEAI